jgi:hypothetical protein
VKIVKSMRGEIAPTLMGTEREWERRAGRQNVANAAEKII